jgi:biopolymer transport protein TolR
MAFGNLERSKTSQPISDINVTPLVDVMLVLLVIFIITAPLMVSSLKLDLPKTEAAQQSDEQNFISISLDKSGVVYLNDKPVTLPALKTALEQRAKAQPDTEVQLNADSTVPYGKIVEVMGMAQGVGLKRIGFVADPVAPAQAPEPGAPVAVAPVPVVDAPVAPQAASK